MVGRRRDEPGTTIEQMRRRPLSGWACGHHSNSLHAALAEPTTRPPSPTTDVTHCAASASSPHPLRRLLTTPFRRRLGFFCLLHFPLGTRGNGGLARQAGKGFMIMISRERSGLIFYTTLLFALASDCDCGPFHHHHQHTTTTAS